MSRRTFQMALASLALVSLLVAGNAAGSDWTGPYIGLNAGAGFSNVRTESNACAGGIVGCEFNLPSVLNALNSDNDFDATTFTGGLQVGYSWQFGNVVVGVEGDINSFRLSSSRDVHAPSMRVTRLASICMKAYRRTTSPRCVAASAGPSAAFWSMARAVSPSPT